MFHIDFPSDFGSSSFVDPLLQVNSDSAELLPFTTELNMWIRRQVSMDAGFTPTLLDVLTQAEKVATAMFGASSGSDSHSADSGARRPSDGGTVPRDAGEGDSGVQRGGAGGETAGGGATGGRSRLPPRSGPSLSSSDSLSGPLPFSESLRRTISRNRSPLLSRSVSSGSSSGRIPGGHPLLRRQTTSEGFRAANLGLDMTSAREARRRIEREIAAMVDRETLSEGFTCQTVQGNFAYWVVQLRFSRRSSNAAEAALAADLSEHAERYGGKSRGHITVEVRFPPQYPTVPPALFLRRPILVDYTGGVLGGAFVMPQLNPEQWNPDLSMHDVIKAARDTLLRQGARVDMSVSTDYPLAGYRAARERLLYQPQQGQTETLFKFSDTLRAISPLSDFFPGLLRGDLPEGFFTGNRVLLPRKILTILQDAAGHDESWLTDAPPTFEINTASGLRLYCGVVEYIDDDKTIVLPEWMLRSAFLESGDEVFVRTVALPKLDLVRLQPRGDNAHVFKKLEDEGLSAKVFLEEALKKYTCLTRGETMPISAFGHQMQVDVLAMKPDAPACAVFTGFEASFGLEFSKTRSDVGAPSEGKRGDGAGAAGGAGGVGDVAGPAMLDEDTRRRRRELANLRFRQRWLEKNSAAQAEAAKWRRGLTPPFVASEDPCVKVRVTLYKSTTKLLLNLNRTSKMSLVRAYLDTVHPLNGLVYDLVRPDGTVVDCGEGATVDSTGIANQAVTQKLRLADACAKCRQLGVVAESAVPPPLVWECVHCTYFNPEHAEVCEVCVMPRGDIPLQPERGAAAPVPGAVSAGSGGLFDDKRLSSYIVSDGDGGRAVMGLCEEHKCPWLDEMQQLGQMKEEDEHLVTEDMVLRTLSAKLI